MLSGDWMEDKRAGVKIRERKVQGRSSIARTQRVQRLVLLVLDQDGFSSFAGMGTCALDDRKENRGHV